MDIKEINNILDKRHPWETTRLQAVSKILRLHLFEGINVLDMGCGDGFVSRSLFRRLRRKNVTAVDIFLNDGLINELEKISDGIIYLKELPKNGCFDLILLLDVIEHLEDDKKYLALLVDKYISIGGKIMITVPAFQYLFSCHDSFLGHHRRYQLKSLEDVARACGLNVISSGYLFLSLILPKFIYFKLLNLRRTTDVIGRWSRGRVITYLIEKILNIDNNFLMLASRFGIKIPGLTGWVLCEKRG